MSRNERVGFQKGNRPLQRFNGLQIHKPKSSNLSSSSSSSSSESPNGGSRFLRSLNSSSSRTHLHRKPRNLPLKSSSVTLKPRSKENEVPGTPFSEKSTKSQPLRLDKKQYGKANRKPTIENGQRPKLCSAVRFGESAKRIGNCTPVGKESSVSGLDSVSIDYVGDDPISRTAVKTPPVEASVSPEIQYGSHSKKAVLNSGATPVCYGASSHLPSGVTDKRKCRRRGSLKGGFEKVNFIDSRDSLVPLPSEASVRWLSSPCQEDSENRSEQCDAIGESVIENNSEFYLGSLGGSEVDLVQFELDSILETLNKVGPSPSSVSLQSEDMDLSSSIGLSQVHENANTVCSWVSDSTVENLALSQMRISWRDGFFSNINENDELDCCRCLSDEEIAGGDSENDFALSSSLRSRVGTESVEKDAGIYKDFYEPFISAQENVKFTSYRLNESAETICTNGGGLVASSDSDWMYFREHNLV